MSSSNRLPNKQDLLIELGTEELPPKALRSLQTAFHHSICAELDRLHIAFEDPNLALASPRRLAVLLNGVDTKQPDQKVESLGPAVAAAFDAQGAPTKAALGFANKVGVEVSELSEVETKKGPRLAFVETKTGVPTLELISGIVETALSALPIPKRMRWGASRKEFIRPTHWLLIMLGSDTPNSEIMGMPAGNTSVGHRFHANHAIRIQSPSTYCDQLLQEGKVVVDLEKRARQVRDQVETIAHKELDGVAVISNDLLDEVAALVEWPVALAGRFDSSFLDIPSEALISSMKEHQKYFHVEDRQGNLLPAFITVSNIESKDPQSVIQGNERVIRPRLADAEFFYQSDKQYELEDFRNKLKPVLFQAQLGSVYDKTVRVSLLAQEIATKIGGDIAAAKRAGELCKQPPFLPGQFLRHIQKIWYSVPVGLGGDWRPSFG